ncbi:chitin-binding domain protein cbd-1-like [Ostrea edulis]|uniref:chitin-binding domain protein cbd-1-like n=1 Tax=Ostrea edulis TaxID=37623 RepID=UPI0020953BF5|nr:chitin-binding domain protein cbd-1-like [Ostrea edulis]
MEHGLRVLVFAAVVVSALAVDCSTMPDGVYEAGCRSFARCTGAEVTIVDCDKGNVYNNATGSCDDPHNVPPPCGVFRDCSNKKDGKYADMDEHCRSYYTCFKGAFLGHNKCPANLVFNEDLQTCDWPESVKPPCGSKSP